MAASLSFLQQRNRGATGEPKQSTLSSMRWQHASANFAKAYAVSVALAPAGDAKRIAVFEPLARFAIR
jgi:hypothetical protein